MLDDKNLFNFEDSDSSEVDIFGTEDDSDLWTVDDIDSDEADYFDECGTHVESYDLNGDGFDDAILFEADINGDSVTDVSSVALDLNDDGIIDAVSYSEDTDFDGISDVEQHQIDFDFDGQTDYTETSVFMNDENGHVNEFFMTATDLDGDGVTDNYDMGFRSADPMSFPTHDEPVDFEDDADFSNDDTEYEYDDTDDSEYDFEDDTDDEILNIPTVDYDPDADNGTFFEDLEQFDPADADLDGIIGDPEDSIGFWECQGFTNRCAIYAQKFVIEEYTGTEVDIEELCDIAEENGWFTEDGGTRGDCIDKLLDHYGVPNETSYNNTIEDLTESLNEGHRIIVAVDADEYWSGENDPIYAPDGSNHAIEVIGIDNSDPENPTVIVNDSGTEGGAGLEIPLETFMDAWEDGGNYMVECM